MVLSFTEENYLKAIFSIGHAYHLNEVSTNQISEHLNNKAASVTDMLKRLAEKKYIDYKPYKGVRLTDKGKKTAVKIVRKHRLWEVFLVEKLNFKWDEVHDIAEQLEHINSDELIEKLDVFLGKPKHDPHGDPIPDVNGKFNVQKSVALSQVKIKQNVVVTGVTDHSPHFLQYLSNSGIGLGDFIRIESVNEYDSLLTIKLNKNKTLFLSHKAASNILVEVRS